MSPKICNISFFMYFGASPSFQIKFVFLSKKEGKDQETIESSTTPDPGYHKGK